MSEEVKTVTLSFGRNSIGQYQASICDENGGFRLMGGKYDGAGTVLIERQIDARAAAEIRCYLDAAFPRAAEPDWTPISDIPPEWKDGRQVHLRGDKGPYGVTSWEAVARWGIPKNWHRDWATWMDGPTENHAVLRLAGYIPTHARLPQKESADK